MIVVFPNYFCYTNSCYKLNIKLHGNSGFVFYIDSPKYRRGHEAVMIVMIVVRFRICLKLVIKNVLANKIQIKTHVHFFTNIIKVCCDL